MSEIINDILKNMAIMEEFQICNKETNLLIYAYQLALDCNEC
ncbi:hypothetical protein [Anaeromicropila populeti]|uniref:Uncharacterized protein n=1 Tax=Anaeromicropila populeti TaxID=37658 RepID=A0A1I6KQB0_9FIRM|nr:hypothetical protein [Anaeromicropila populeti]SFR93367.1 hypothetical protein SAMN05661086_02571 [Anaeromicropila populeti]